MLPGSGWPALRPLKPRLSVQCWPVSRTAASGLASLAPRLRGSGRETVRCLGTICLHALVGRTALLSVIVTICFPPSCLLMFSCFKTEMSQIGSRFRKKCLGGKLQVAMGDSVFRSHWRKNRVCEAGRAVCQRPLPGRGWGRPCSPGRRGRAGLCRGVKARLWACCVSRRVLVCAHSCACVNARVVRWQGCVGGWRLVFRRRQMQKERAAGGPRPPSRFGGSLPSLLLTCICNFK